MDPRYGQTFARHRLLLLAPILVATLIAVWFVAGAPAAYQSTTSVWFDDSHPSVLTVVPVDGNAVPPAVAGQTLLNEMLTTRTFRLKVAYRAPLAKYLESHSDAGWSPTGLIADLQGPGKLSERLLAALGPGKVTSLVSGPQILALSFQAADPRVATETLRALVAEFRSERADDALAQARASVAYYEAQLTAATKAVDSGRTRLEDYRLANPTSDAVTDPDLRELTRVERAAVSRVLAATNSRNQAAVNLATPVADNSTFRVLDQARTPDGPVSGKKKIVIAAIIGLLLGGLSSLIGLIGLIAHENRASRRGSAAQSAQRTSEPLRGPAARQRDETSLEHRVV